MAAVSNTLFALLSPGDRVVSVKDTYGGTNRIFTDFLPRFGIEVELCDTTDHDADRGRGRRRLQRCSTSRRRPTRRSRSSTSRVSPPPATRPAPSWSSTTPSPRRSTRTRWRWAPTSSCTAPPSSSAATPTCSAARSAAPRSSSTKVYHYREITGATLDPMAAYLLIRSMKTLALRIAPAERERAAHRALARGAAGRLGRQLPGPRIAPAATRSRRGRCAASAAC